jgi:hypothetical protein
MSASRVSQEPKKTISLKAPKLKSTEHKQMHTSFETNMENGQTTLHFLGGLQFSQHPLGSRRAKVPATPIGINRACSISF